MKKRVIKVVQFGVGPVGAGIVRLAASKPGVRIVGAVDLLNAGADLGEVAGLGRKLGVLIEKDAKTVLERTKPDVVMHATGSVLKNIFPQLKTMIEAGVNVVSTCEEMSYPFGNQTSLASRIDKLAKKFGVTVMSTGINPGFIMDAWPLFMTGVCQNVKKIKVARIQDATPRRLPFQKKIGAGLSLKEFQDLVESGTIRHVGLTESIGMIAAGLGWNLDKITETIEPVVAKKSIKSQYIAVKAGQAAGVRQMGRGFQDGREMIILEFEACLGARESYDAVYIEGTPSMEVVIKGGVHGDLATAAMIVNSLPRAVDAPPGLLTMKDLPPVCTLPE
jgi:2,4-diaminopentanoate dehydrogenase